MKWKVQIQDAVRKRFSILGNDACYSAFYQCECGFPVPDFPNHKTGEICCPKHGWTKAIMIDPEKIIPYL